MEKHKEIFEFAVRYYGVESQLGRFHEKVGELMQALNKDKRQTTSLTRWKVLEEIADVEIMLGQLKEIYNNTGEVDDIKDAKLKRLSQRMGIDFEQL